MAVNRSMFADSLRARSHTFSRQQTSQRKLVATEVESVFAVHHCAMLGVDLMERTSLGEALDKLNSDVASQSVAGLDALKTWLQAPVFCIPWHLYNGWGIRVEN